MTASMSPAEFVSKWEQSALKERASAQEHFLDVCKLMGHPTPADLDKTGEFFAFEYGMKTLGGTQGYADVFYKGYFAIEYKGKGKYNDLSGAYQQLQRYRENLFNPPLLVVCDIENWEIHTNFHNTESKVYRFTNRDITDIHVLRWLEALFTDPNRLHPNRNTAEVTEAAAKRFEIIARNMREWESEPERIATFLTKLVLCLFAEDVGLLPTDETGKGIFTAIVEDTRTNPDNFVQDVSELFKAMARGGRAFRRDIHYFNGALFNSTEVARLEYEALNELQKAANLNWSAVEPTIFGTLFEHSLDPSKRAHR